MPKYRTYWTRQNILLDWRQCPAHLHVTLDAANEHFARAAADQLAQPLMGGVDYVCQGTWGMSDDDPPEMVALDEDGKPWRGPRARTIYDAPAHTGTPVTDRLWGMVCQYCRDRDTCEVRSVEHSVWVSTDVVLVHVQAAVCRTCGMATPDTAGDALVRAVRQRLVMGGVVGWRAIGTVYRVS